MHDVRAELDARLDASRVRAVADEQMEQRIAVDDLDGVAHDGVGAESEGAVALGLDRRQHGRAGPQERAAQAAEGELAVALGGELHGAQRLLLPGIGHDAAPGQPSARRASTRVGLPKIVGVGSRAAPRRVGLPKIAAF